MVLAVCVDDRGGMAFHGRRQSMDRALRADLLAMAGAGPLWMSPYTRRQFCEQSDALAVDEAFLDKAGPGELCFAEFPPLVPWLDRAEGLVLYRWNRAYPADRHLDFTPAEAGFALVRRVDFPGYSHKTITKEVYRK